MVKKHCLYEDLSIPRPLITQSSGTGYLGPGDHSEIRTHDPLIESRMLLPLGYVPSRWQNYTPTHSWHYIGTAQQVLFYHHCDTIDSCHTEKRANFSCHYSFHYCKNASCKFCWTLLLPLPVPTALGNELSQPLIWCGIAIKLRGKQSRSTRKKNIGIE